VWPSSPWAFTKSSRKARAWAAQGEGGGGVCAAELFFDEDACDEALALTAEGFGQGEEAQADLVAGSEHVVGEGPEALELADARGDGRLGELGDAVLHEPLVFGRLELDHRALVLPSARLLDPAENWPDDNQIRGIVERHYVVVNGLCAARRLGPVPGRSRA
jgi:hypothetical protein